jgi:hypothetical protein
MQATRSLRKVSWGMSPAQVRMTEEGTPAIADGDSLAYSVTLFGYSATLLYTFARGRLVRGAYIIDHPNDVEDVSAHETIQAQLVSKYGEPRRQAEWRDPRRPRWPETYGEMAKAIATGELKLFDHWQSDDSLITLMFTEQSDAYNAMVLLDYTSQEYSEQLGERQFRDDSDLL